MKPLKDLFGRLERWWYADAVELVQEITPSVERVNKILEASMKIVRVGDHVRVEVGDNRWVKVNRAPVGEYELTARIPFDRDDAWQPWKNHHGCYTQKARVATTMGLRNALALAYQQVQPQLKDRAQQEEAERRANEPALI